MSTPATTAIANTASASLRERIRDVRQGPDGFLYLLTDNADGRVLKVLP